MKKNYMKPAAQGVRFAVNENIAFSGPTIVLEGMGQIFEVPAKEVDGVLTAYITIPEGYGDASNQTVTGKDIYELGDGLIEAGLTYAQYMEIIMGYIPQMIFKN